MNVNEYRSKLREFMVNHRISSKEVAIKANISVSLINRMIKNEVSLSLKNLDKIILAYPEFEDFIKGVEKRDVVEQTNFVEEIQSPYNQNQLPRINDFILSKCSSKKDFSIKVGISEITIGKLSRGEIVLTDKLRHKILAVYPDFMSFISNGETTSPVYSPQKRENDIIDELIKINKDLIKQNSELIKLLSTLQGEKKLTDTNHQGLQSSKSTEETIFGAAA